jgi:hypothetical protein
LDWSPRFAGPHVHFHQDQVEHGHHAHPNLYPGASGYRE